MNLKSHQKFSIVVRQSFLPRLTCRTRCLFAFECTLEDLKTFHRSGAAQSSKNPVHVDPPNRKDPTVSARTDCRCSASRCSAGNPVIRESARKARRRFEGVATTTPASVRPLRDRIQPRWDLTKAVMCGRDWWQTEKVKNCKSTVRGILRIRADSIKRLFT